MRSDNRSFIFAVQTAWVLSTATAAIANQPPVADAGPDRYMDHGSIVLDGTRSVDPDGSETLQYAWSPVSGAAVSLSDADTATPAVHASQSSQIEVAVVQLVVSDGASSSSPDEMTITIVPEGTEAIRLIFETDPFDPAKPTYIYNSYCGWRDGLCVLCVPETPSALIPLTDICQTKPPNLWLPSATLLANWGRIRKLEGANVISRVLTASTEFSGTTAIKNADLRARISRDFD